METQKPLLKDEDGEEVDVHLYRSMIGSLMYLTSSRPDIMFVVCACARYQVNPKVSHLHAVKRIFRCRMISWLYKKHTVVANSTTEAKYVVASSCYGQVLWIQNQLLDYIDSNEKKLIQMIKIHTDNNVADLLTKSFDANWNGKATKDEIRACTYYCYGKLMLLGMHLLLLWKANVARHKLTTAVEIAFLEKPTESEGFEQIVDFLNASSIRYALTVNPTIYTLCIQQFWATVKVKTVNGEVQLQALVDGKKIVITESTIRRDLQLEDDEGVDCKDIANITRKQPKLGKNEHETDRVHKSWEFLAKVNNGQTLGQPTK
ncbi:hypothetical protein Tco_0576661 [Tanacetum coccineum]